MVQESSQEMIFCLKFSRVESDSREGIILYSSGLYCSADVLGVPVPDRLDQEDGGRDESHQHQHSPDHPAGSGLTAVDVGQSVDTAGGEEIVQLPPEV